MYETECRHVTVQKGKKDPWQSLNMFMLYEVDQSLLVMLRDSMAVNMLYNNNNNNVR